MAKTSNIDGRGGRLLEARPIGLPDVPLPVAAARKRSSTDGALAQLTIRECEVLEALVRGLTNKQIGIELAISHRTVEVHRARLMRKLGAPTLAALLAAVLPQRGKLEAILRAHR